ncbi:uncharacterized protein [Prorops nasuta]|uniref:uncharacterized protein n=1 Tax=Prorops nasuta TaxID=863751 RepID=UPI0034CEC4B7
MWEDIQVIIRYLQRNNENDVAVTETESVLNKFDFPLKTIADLQCLEDYLDNTNNKLILTRELTKIGGITYKHMAKRIMIKILSNEVAEQYSWVGFKGKNNFSILRIAIVITDAKQKTHRTTTLSEIESVLKGWLVKAKFRKPKED